MSFIKRSDVQWDIVRKTVIRQPWIVLGWPITAFYSGWGVSKKAPRFSKRSYESHPNTVIRLPWVARNCENKNLRSSLTFLWFGWFWFWRDWE